MCAFIFFHFLLEHRCVPRIAFPTDTVIDVSLGIFIDMSIGMLITMFLDTSIDMLIDMSIDIFLEVLTCSLARLLTFAVDSFDEGRRKEWTSS